jgi:hypothetical protein
MVARSIRMALSLFIALTLPVTVKIASCAGMGIGAPGFRVVAETTVYTSSKEVLAVHDIINKSRRKRSRRKGTLG